MTCVHCGQVFGALAFSASVVLKPREDLHLGYSFAAMCVYVFILLPYLGFVYFVLYRVCSEDGATCSFEIKESSDQSTLAGATAKRSSQVDTIKPNANAMGVHTDVDTTDKQDEVPLKAPEKSCWERRVGKWTGGAAEEEVRHALTALAVTMRLWLEGCKTKQQMESMHANPIHSLLADKPLKEEPQLTSQWDVMLELEEVFHDAPCRDNSPSGVGKVTAAVGVAAAEFEATEAQGVGVEKAMEADGWVTEPKDATKDGTAGTAQAAKLHQFQVVLEKSESTSVDLHDAAQEARDISDNLRATGDLVKANEIENLSFQLDAAAEQKAQDECAVRWPDRDATALSWIATFERICERIEQDERAVTYTLRPPPSKASTCSLRIHLEQACIEVCDELRMRIEALSHLELSTRQFSQCEPGSHDSDLHPSIECQVVFDLPVTAELEQAMATFASLRQIRVIAHEVHTKRRVSQRTLALYGVLYAQYVASARYVELVNHCCIFCTGLSVGLCQEYPKLQVCLF